MDQNSQTIFRTSIIFFDIQMSQKYWVNTPKVYYASWYPEIRDKESFFQTLSKYICQANQAYWPTDYVLAVCAYLGKQSNETSRNITICVEYMDFIEFMDFTEFGCFNNIYIKELELPGY